MHQNCFIEINENAFKNITGNFYQTYEMSNIEEIQSIIVSWFNYAFYSQTWQKNQQEMFDSLRERGLPVKLGGDARCCSPGHTAKFGVVLPHEHGHIKSSRCSAGPGIFFVVKSRYHVLYQTLTSNNV